MLADASKLLAVVCMLVASRHGGMVPNKPAYLKRIAYLDSEPDLSPLISCGFLEIPLADASIPERLRTNACLEEKREEEIRGEKKEESAGAPTKEYVFEGEVFNLTAKSLAQWQVSFSLVPDILAEVRVAEAYYIAEGETDKKKLFFKISQWLKRSHDGELAKRAKEREAEDRMYRIMVKSTPDEDRAAYERQQAEYAKADARRATEAMH